MELVLETVAHAETTLALQEQWSHSVAVDVTPAILTLLDVKEADEFEYKAMYVAAGGIFGTWLHHVNHVGYMGDLRRLNHTCVRVAAHIHRDPATMLHVVNDGSMGLLSLLLAASQAMLAGCFVRIVWRRRG